MRLHVYLSKTNKQYNTNTLRHPKMTQQTINQRAIQITLDLGKAVDHNLAFCSAFQQAATDTLVALGEPAQKVIFRCLEHDFGISQDNLGANPGTFAEALERIFGPDAAWLIESRIIRVLHELVPGFKYSSSNGELFFVDYVNALSDYL